MQESDFQDPYDSYHQPLSTVIIHVFCKIQKLSSKKGYSEKDISKELKVHWYPVRKALSKMQTFDDKKLLHYLYQLSNLDIQIKTGKLEKELALELFILKI